MDNKGIKVMAYIGVAVFILVFCFALLGELTGTSGLQLAKDTLEVFLKIIGVIK